MLGLKLKETAASIQHYLKSLWQEGEVAISGSRTYNTKAYQYPSFSALLPYRHIDNELNFFLNSINAGFFYQVTPFTGGNETLAIQLDDLLRNQVSEDFTLHLILVKHNQVADRIDAFAAQFNTPHFKELADLGEQLKTYYQKAAQSGFTTRDGIKAGLKQTDCFIVVDCPIEEEVTLKTKLARFQIQFEASLRALKLGFQKGNAQTLLGLLSFYLNPNPKQIDHSQVDYDPKNLLNEQTHFMGFDCQVHADHLLLAGRQNNQSFETAVSTLTLSKLPSSFCFWDNINSNHNVFDRGKSLFCNHIISVIYKVEKQSSALTKANRKTKSFDKKAKSAYAVQVAGTEEQAQHWKAFREALNQQQTKAVKMLYNVVLFSEPHQKEQDVAEAQNVFASNGLTLDLAKHMQLPYFLASMPFLFTNHLQKDFALPRMMWPISSWNATQYMPLLSDWQGLGKGILMPTLRDQFNLLNPFSDQLGTNYNIAITGTSGGGKSFAIQMLMLNVLFNGGDVFVIDIGGSYKKLCQSLNGVYLEYESLHLNPFTHVQNLFEEIDELVDLFEVLACSRTKASDDDRGTLREAIILSFEKTANDTNINQVAEMLERLYIQAQDTYPSARLLAKNLKPYCLGAEHGKVFNSPSELAPDARFIAIDLKAIEDNVAIRLPVLLTLFSQLQRRMFHSDRSRQKMCIIDEAWKFFTGDKIASQFITKGFRTGRRHKASFVTITQGVSDYYAFEEARAAWENSALKLIFLQDNASLIEHNKLHDTFSEYEMALLKTFPLAKDAGYSQVLVKAGGLSSFHRLFVDPITQVLLSSDGDDFTQVERYREKGLSLMAAVKQVAIDKGGINETNNVVTRHRFKQRFRELYFLKANALCRRYSRSLSTAGKIIRKEPIF